MAPALVYLPSLGFDFVFDDLSLIGEQGPVYFGTEWLAYRPVRHLSHLLDHVLGGGSAWAYHLDNLILHALACLAVAGSARRLDLSKASALVAALIFGLHPLGVEAVAYVSGRRDLLATVLGLGAVYVWLGRRPRPYLAALLLVAATGAKESGVIFAAVLVPASMLGLGFANRRAAVVTATAAASVCLFLIAAYGGLEPVSRVADAAGWSSALRLSGHYAAGLALTRPFNVVYPGLESGAVLAGREIFSVGLVVLICAAGALRLKRVGLTRQDGSNGVQGAQAVFLCGWAGLCLLSVVFGAGLHEPGADRHAYPLLAPLSLLAGAGLLGVERRTSRIGAVAAAVVLAGLAAVTFTRQQDWRDPAALWAAAVRAAPISPRAHHNLAGLHLAQGRYPKARRHLLRAVEIDADYAPARLGLAHVACARGRYAKGRAHLVEARALGARAPDFEDVAQSCVQPR